MPRSWIVVLIVFCTALNGAGFLWSLFEPVPLYDEVAHFVTPFLLVGIAAEIVYRAGGDDEFFDTPIHAVATGAVIGLVGAIGWEIVEAILDYMGFSISHAFFDSVFDIVLGVLGGAAGAWTADRYLDRFFGRSRTNPRIPSRRPRVR